MLSRKATLRTHCTNMTKISRLPPARELPPAARRAVRAARAGAGGAAARVPRALRGRTARLRHAVLRPPAREAHAVLRGECSAQCVTSPNTRTDHACCRAWRRRWRRACARTRCATAPPSASTSCAACWRSTPRTKVLSRRHTDTGTKTPTESHSNNQSNRIIQSKQFYLYICCMYRCGGRVNKLESKFVGSQFRSCDRHLKKRGANGYMAFTLYLLNYSSYRKFKNNISSKINITYTTNLYFLKIENNNVINENG